MSAPKEGWETWKKGWRPQETEVVGVPGGGVGPWKASQPRLTLHPPVVRDGPPPLLPKFASYSPETLNVFPSFFFSLPFSFLFLYFPFLFLEGGGQGPSPPTPGSTNE